MDRPPVRRAAFVPQPGDPCPDCGGSGVLRTDAAGYRTCLACVGQGMLPRLDTAGFSSALASPEVASPEVAAAASKEPAVVRRRCQGLSAWSSAG